MTLQSDTDQSRRGRSTVVGLMVGVLVIGAVMGGMMRLVGRAHEAARKSECIGHFKQVELALHNYNSAWGVPPPAVTNDANGRPMHSWRVLILPFLEQKPLYDAYNFDQPWNGPDNRKLAARLPNLYTCPSDHSPDGLRTCIVAVTGPGTMFDAARPRSIESLKPGAAGSTVWLAEVANRDILWMEPRDLDVTTMSLRINDPRRPSVSTVHPAGPTVGTVDGMIHTLRPDTPRETLRRILRINTGGFPDQKIEESY